MPLFDLPLPELRQYQAPDPPPADFDDFWQATLQETNTHPLAATFESRADDPLDLVTVQDVRFAGFGGQTIRGWLLAPAGLSEPRATIVRYIGYGGGRGLPLEHLPYVAAGFVVFVMDTRAQGSAWSPGDTADEGSTGPHYPGFLTRGIQSRETYYYRRVYADAVRALEAAAAHPLVDRDRLAVCGGSQGGGLALAAAGLAPERVRLALVDVPFLCHFRRAIELTDQPPYREIAEYLRCHRAQVDAALNTLAYFDGIHFAARVRARTLMSVGLMDMVCPPSTIFAAYNRIPAEKDIRTFTYNQHEGGGNLHLEEQLHYLREHLR